MKLGYRFERFARPFFWKNYETYVVMNIEIGGEIQNLGWNSLKIDLND
jgi:hypothetical protein